MKIALLADTHFGARSDSQRFDDSFRRFYTEQFFPYLEAHGIKTLIHLGDVFDRRKYINFQILQSAREYFFEPLHRLGVDMYVYPGNHDTYYKNTNRVNSLNLLLGEYQNIKVLNRACEWHFDRKKGVVTAAMIPWICDENFDETMEFLENTKAELCFGHFEIAGFEMHKGMGAESGFDASLFKKFKQVYTGHFHHKSSRGNIHYLGSPYELTWNDYDDQRGFHILDTDTLQLTFIANEHIMHHKIYYDDTKLMSVRPKQYAGCAVKVIVVNKTDFARFDALIDDLYQAGVYELKVLEDFTEVGETEADSDDVDVEDTFSLLSEHVDNTEVPVDKDKLKSTLKELFVEAQNLEV